MFHYTKDQGWNNLNWDTPPAYKIGLPTQHFKNTNKHQLFLLCNSQAPGLGWVHCTYSRYASCSDLTPVGDSSSASSSSSSRLLSFWISMLNSFVQRHLSFINHKYKKCKKIIGNDDLTCWKSEWAAEATASRSTISLKRLYPCYNNSTVTGPNTRKTMRYIHFN